MTVRVQGTDGGYDMRAGYLVGCDGARSEVRRRIGVPFSGSTDPRVVSRAAHVTLPGSSVDAATAEIVLPDGDRIGLYAWHRTERGTHVVVPHGPGVSMVSVIEWDGPPIAAESPVSIGEVRASLHRVLGRDLPLAAPTTAGPHLLRRRYAANARVADSYRRGRVFLAGDAAHVLPRSVRPVSPRAPGRGQPRLETRRAGARLGGATRRRPARPSGRLCRVGARPGR